MSCTFSFPSTGQTVCDQALLLAIDDVSLPLRKNLCFYLSKPSVRPAPVLEPSPRASSAPDNLAVHFYGTVLHDGGLFRMWYYACHWGRNPDWPPEQGREYGDQQEGLFGGPLCYAESDDGLVWRKPALGQVLFKGSRQNNAIALAHANVSVATVIKDDEDPDPDRRYKLVYECTPIDLPPPVQGYGFMPTCALAVSPDGLKWTDLGKPYRREFVEHSSFYKHGGLYIINQHGMAPWLSFTEGGNPSGRRGLARFSYDFDHWAEGFVDSFQLPEPHDRAQRGLNGEYDQVHLGVGATSFGTVCVGLYGLWHNADFAKAFEKISCDLGLVVSNDGLHFREPVPGHVYIGREDSPATPISGGKHHTNLCQANGILNVGDETRIYHGRWRNTGWDFENYGAEVALATLPRDRWGALGLTPGAEEGTVWSAPLVLPKDGCSVTLNADGADGMRVEVADERFQFIPGFSKKDAGRAGASVGLDCVVHWPEGQHLATLAGRTIRFRISLRKSAGTTPRLYALTLHPKE